MVAGEAESQTIKEVKEKLLKDNDSKRNEKENNQNDEKEGGI